MYKIRFMSLLVCLALALAVFADVRNPGAPTSSAYRYSNQPATVNYESQYQLGNDVITGNVGGGKHFRGVVPYGSSYEFQGNQGSSTLNDFYRRSASVPQSQTQYQPQPQRYYLPSSGVTSIQSPTSSGGLSIPSVQTNPSSHQINLAEAGLKQIEIQPLGQPGRNRVISRPMEKNLSEVRAGLEQYLQNVNQPKKAGDDNENLTQALQNAKDNKATFFEPLMARPMEPVKSIEPKIFDEKSREFTKFEPRFEQETPGEEKIVLPAKPKQDLYDTMLEKIQQQFTEDIETKRLEKLTLAEEEKQAAIEKRKQQQEKIEQILQQRSAARIARKEADKTVEQQGDETSQQETELPDTIKSFAGSTRDNFDIYMKQAEEFMKQGAYYKAADAYSLASAYQNANPLPYIGRSIALFAAGEYMSSSYYLNLSLRIFEELGMFKIGIKEFIGNEDVYVKRLAELQELQIQSNSPEMLMLLAYVYHNTGQHAKAEEAIKDVEKKLTDDKAVQALKQAIIEAK